MTGARQVTIDDWLARSVDSAPKTRRSKGKHGLFAKRIPDQDAPFVIYGVRCPIAGDLVYVGATSDLKRRATSHYYRSGQNVRLDGLDNVARFMLQLRQQGLFPTFEVLAKCPSDGAAAVQERRFIDQLKPRLNSDMARPYPGTSGHKKKTVAFPNGFLVEQEINRAPSALLESKPSDSLAVRKIKLDCNRLGISLISIASAVGTTYQNVGQILSCKYSPGLIVGIRLSQLFEFPITDWVENLSDQEAA